MGKGSGNCDDRAQIFSDTKRDDTSLPVLVFSPRTSLDRSRLIGACHRTGLCQPLIMDGWKVPANIAPADYRVYAEALYAEAVGDGFGIGLLDIDARWLASLPYELVQRRIDIVPFNQLQADQFPLFIKSIDDKMGGVKGQVYTSIPTLADGLASDMDVCVSEIVTFKREVCTFLQNGHIQTGSQYFYDGARQEQALEGSSFERAVHEFIDELRATLRDDLPHAVVVDVGELPDGSWAVIEANGVWGAGLYQSDPDKALGVILGGSTRWSDDLNKFYRKPPTVDWGSA